MIITIRGRTSERDMRCNLDNFAAFSALPRADTYRRLFERISPTALKQSFDSWLSSLVLDLNEITAIPALLELLAPTHH
jgi:hypothetical protein